jgi:hypothetical protein
MKRDFRTKVEVPPGSMRGTFQIEAADGALLILGEFDTRAFPHGYALGLALSSLGAIMAGVPPELLNGIIGAADADPLTALAAGSGKPPVLS